MIDGCTLSGCRLEKFRGGGVEVDCGYGCLSRRKPKAQGSVRQRFNPPWREKTKLRESDLIGIVLVVIDSVCYGFVVP